MKAAVAVRVARVLAPGVVPTVQDLLNFELSSKVCLGSRESSHCVVDGVESEELGKKSSSLSASPFACPVALERVGR